MRLRQKIDRAVSVLEQAARDFSPACFSSSLGAEDMALTDLIAKRRLGIEMFSLDTGCLPQSTYDLMRKVPERYGVPLKVYSPDGKAVDEYVERYGVNGFYESVEARKACCLVRKVEPLKRALAGKRAWITGLRRDQSVTRAGLEEASFDDGFGLWKFNPLLEWSHEDVWAYIRRQDVPYNALHDRSCPSVGCAPCTRPVAPGEDIRAGRWWWERPEDKECGLHAGEPFA